MSDCFDALETRDPGQREAALLRALPAQVTAAQATPAFAEILRGVDAAAITSREALARPGRGAPGAARVPVARADLRTRGPDR